MSPKDFHAVIPRTCVNATILENGLCMIKVIDLEMGDYPGLYEWALSNHMSF